MTDSATMATNRPVDALNNKAAQTIRESYIKPHAGRIRLTEAVVGLPLPQGIMRSDCSDISHYEYSTCCPNMAAVLTS